MPEKWTWQSVRLRESVRDILVRAAKRQHRSQSEQIRHYIEDGLQRDGFEVPEENGHSKDASTGP